MEKMNRIISIMVLFCIVVFFCGCGKEAEPSLIPPSDVIESSKTADQGDSAVAVMPGDDDSEADEAEADAAMEAPSRDPDVRCYNNSECGLLTVTDKFCKLGAAYRKVKKSTCIKPGTKDSYCSDTQGDELIKLCDSQLDRCIKGECKEIASIPCDDSDGSKDGFTKGRVVDATGRVYEDECKDKNNVLEAFCEFRYFAAGTIAQLGAHEKIFCRNGCKDGACLPEEED